MYSSTRSLLPLQVVSLLLVASCVATLAPTADAQTPLTAGYRDFAFGPSVTAEPTGEKPESKIWWNDGHWWGSLWDSAAEEYRIHRFKVGTQSWVNTGTAIDDRRDTKADVLWDGTHLYVVSHFFEKGTPLPAAAHQSGRLYRYRYAPDTDTYELDFGFPVVVNRAKTRALVMAKDSTGQLWITWVQDGRVKINRSVGDDSRWGAPFDLPVQANNTRSDDISAVTAFGGDRIGIMWSNRSDKKTYFAVHRDDDADTAWQPAENALADASLGGVADNHINLATDCATGEVYAVTKTSLSGPTDPLVFLLKRDASGTWSRSMVATVADGYTRPVLLLQSDERRAYVFAASDENHNGYDAIYMKSTSLDDLTFAPGIGTPFILSATDIKVNNPSTTKQCITNVMGLLVIAGDKNADSYFHNYIRFASRPSIASFDPPSGLAGTQVTINGNNLGDATAVAFAGAPVDDFSIASDTRILATVPFGATTGPISVRNPNGSGLSSQEFEIPAPPVITSFTPRSAAVGTEVTVRGSGLTGVHSVVFNGTAAAQLTVETDNRLRVVVPDGATTGPITVANSMGTHTSSTNFEVIVSTDLTASFDHSSSVNRQVAVMSEVRASGAAVERVGGWFTSLASRPAYTPGVGSDRLLLLVTGLEHNVDNRIESVSYGGQKMTPAVQMITSASGYRARADIWYLNEAGIQAATGNQIVFSRSAGEPFEAHHALATFVNVDQSDPIGAIASAQTSAGSAIQDPLRLSLSGVVHSSMTVAGAVCGNGGSYVQGPSSDCVEATDRSASSSSMSVAEHASTPVIEPVVSDFSPKSGPEGTQVRLMGRNFTNVSAIDFAGTPTTFTMLSDSECIAVVPSAAATGRIRMTSPDGAGLSPRDFVVVPLPEVDSFSPAAGSVGTEVTLVGRGFAETREVSFNGTPSVSFTVDSDTRLRAYVPVGASTGPITVDNGAGSYTSTTSFEIVEPTLDVTSSFDHSSGVNRQVLAMAELQASSAPVERLGNWFASLDTAPVYKAEAGSERLLVLVTGMEHDVDNEITAITYGGQPMTAAARMITTASGYRARVEMWYLTEAGIQAAASNTMTIARSAGQPFEVQHALATFSNVDQLAPIGASGATETSGTGTITDPIELTLSGIAPRSFVVAAAVCGNGGSFTQGPSSDCSEATDLSAASSSMSVAERAASPAVGAPEITAFTPASGPIGTEVTITGMHLANTTKVEFDGTPAPSFRVDSDDSLRATVPPGASSGRVRVTTLVGVARSDNDFVVTGQGGGGSVIVLEETQPGGSTAQASVSTDAPVTGVTGQLYLVSVSSKSYAEVKSINGLGLLWTRVGRQCSGRGKTGVEVWMAQGAAQTGVVTAELMKAPSNAVIAVSRYSGVAESNPLGNMVSGNSNGVSGTCSDGVDSDAYSFELDATVGEAVVYAAIALRTRHNEPGNGYTERVDFRWGDGGARAGLAIQDRVVSSPARVAVNGTLNRATDWAVLGLEIKPNRVASPPADDKHTGGDTKGPEISSRPTNTRLLQNAPNPFMPSTVIRFDMAQAGRVRINVFDVRGRLVKTLASEQRQPGRYQITWNGDDNQGKSVAPGVYFYRMVTPGFTQTRRLLRIR